MTEKLRDIVKDCIELGVEVDFYLKIGWSKASATSCHLSKFERGKEGTSHGSFCGKGL